VFNLLVGCYYTVHQGAEKPYLLMPSLGYVSIHFKGLLCIDGQQELGVPFISVSAPSIVSGMSGESEKTLRDTFEEAKVHSIMFDSEPVIIDFPH
jgi:hypothetical protein